MKHKETIPMIKVRLDDIEKQLKRHGHVVDDKTKRIRFVRALSEAEFDDDKGKELDKYPEGCDERTFEQTYRQMESWEKQRKHYQKNRLPPANTQPTYFQQSQPSQQTQPYPYRPANYQNPSPSPAPYFAIPPSFPMQLNTPPTGFTSQQSSQSSTPSSLPESHSTTVSWWTPTYLCCRFNWQDTPASTNLHNGFTRVFTNRNGLFPGVLPYATTDAETWIFKTNSKIQAFSSRI
jgi:hypothetical protein